MKDYIFSLVCVSLIAAMLGILCPHDATGQKSVRFLISVVIISIIFLPPSRIEEIINEDYFAGFEEIFDGFGEGADTSDFADSLERYSECGRQEARNPNGWGRTKPEVLGIAERGRNSYGC